jgi:hypothetical protein
MGNKHNQAIAAKEKEESKKIYNINIGLVTKNHFDFMYVVGRGGFGKVSFIYKLGLESLL